MSIGSLEFIVLLPLFLTLYYLLPRRAQVVLLYVASILFVLSNGFYDLAVFIGIVVISASLAYFTPIGRFPIAAVVFLGVALVAFKYLPWFGSLLGVPQAWLSWPQPVGISYYVFILAGFFIDAAREARPVSPLRAVGLLLFFPVFTSGPILRLRSWSAQMPPARRQSAMRNVTVGAQIFLIGCIKKLLIADPIGATITPIWADPEQFSSAAIRLAMVGFYVQLFADFSGYTDMARGVARMMGYRLPINFRAPYFATTPMDFWGRWHMSLTGWVRDYVFNPMSVVVWRRVSRKALVPYASFGLVVALMTLVGLWHGATISFILFGMLHGILIGAWYAIVGNGRRMNRNQRVGSWFLFQGLLLISLVLFRTESLSGAWTILGMAVDRHAGIGVSDAYVGMVLAIALVFSMQWIEGSSQRGKVARFIARYRNDARLFPLMVVGILFVCYMKGLTLEGVWISPADPFFNRGQEKFIYFKF